MNYDALHFGYEIANPDRLSIYDEATVAIDGVDLEMAVIGSSHCVRAPSIGFEEIASCDERTVGDCRTIDIGERGATTVRHDSEAAACTTAIRLDPIEVFPAEDAFDLRYDFAERAVTAIDVLDCGYETWHTYPEHDCAVYTETTFERLEPGGAPSADRGDEDLAEDLASL